MFALVLVWFQYSLVTTELGKRLKHKKPCSLNEKIGYLDPGTKK